MHLPYLTADVPGIGGKIKSKPEDFFVEELPLYEASGEGEHTYVTFEKVGVTTFDAVNLLAEFLDVDKREIGFAGMKDAAAVTRQTVSILGTTPEAVQAFEHESVRIIDVQKHRNKLRLGHLAGNRFAIKIREVDPLKVVTLKPVIESLQKRGMPNYFGEQRFGRRNNNDLLGAAFVRGDDREVLRLLLGDPDPNSGEPQQITQARTKFDKNDFEGAMKSWPRWAGLERRVLARFIKSRKPKAATAVVDFQIRRLWVTAAQSRVFNDVLAKRVQTIDRVMQGDMAYKHDNGACFWVEDVATEQARCDAFEISPTGPMVGRRMSMPRGEPGEIEMATFEAFKLRPEDFRGNDRDRSHGDRRPLRVLPRELQLESGVDKDGGYVTVAFTLPAGSYATMLMRELMKNDVSVGPTREEGEADDETSDGESPEPSDNVETSDAGDAT